MKKVLLWLLGVVVYYQLPAQSKLIITDDYDDGEIYEAQLNGLGLTQTVEFSPRNRGGYPISFIQHDSSYYGITDYYGIYDNGTLYRYDYPSDSITVLHDFVDNNPTALIAGPNNRLYGTWSDGNLFSYNLATNTFAQLGNCGGTNTYQQLMLASNRKIYGTTRSGGDDNEGVIFELNPVGNIITVLHHFAGTDGENPNVEMVQASDGLLYGVTSSGGVNDNGVLFSINPTTGAFTLEYEFNSSVSGRDPQTNLIAAPDGLLYGILRQQVNSGGGGGINERVANSSNDYTFFSFNVATNQFLPKAEIDENDIGDGVYKLSLINGDIYGMTSDDGGDEGQGVLFRYSTTEDTVYQVLSFDDNIAWGESKVLLAPDGQLIYTSNDGDYLEDGAIITVNAVTQESDIKVVFNEYPAGERPEGALVQTSDNRFFGLTDQGGKYGAGTIYEYLPNTRQIIGRYNFNYDSLYLSNYYLTAGSDGLLYGAVAYDGNGNISSRINPLVVGGGGGSSSPSTDARYLFSFNPDTYELDTLLNFNTVDGDYPRYSYQFDGDNLYGVVTNDGANNYGGIFRFNLQTKQYELLQDFDNTTIGRNPRPQALVNGYLYGLTQTGAANNYGAIYKYDIANDQMTIVKGFANNDERATRSGFMLHSNGKLYLETYNLNFGALLELDPSTDVITTEFFFNLQGVRALNQSYSNQISEGTDGRIYGSFYKTSSGSPRGIYAYDLSTDTFEELMAVRQVNYFQALAVCIAPLAIQPEDMTACAGQSWSVTLNSQNTATYEWKKDGVVIANATSDTFSINAVSATDAGTYTAIMTNACGTDSVSFTLTVSDIQLSVNVADVKCNGSNDGSITVTPTGGIAPYEYSLDGVTFQSDSIFSELTAGDYSITVRDANGCVTGAEASVGQPDALSFSTAGRDETCQPGFIAVTVQGGTGPYQYSLDGENYQESNQLDGVAAGEYTVYVRDANGCVATENHVVGQVAALEVTEQVTESTEYPENGSITLAVMGGSAPYTYVWSTGDSTATISDLVPNDYSVTVTDRNGCSVGTAFTVGGVTSIADLQKQGISIYPNPVVDRWQVRLPANTSIRSASLFSPQGEQIRNFSLKGGLNQLQSEALKPGIYLLQLDNGVSTRLVIKK